MPVLALGALCAGVASGCDAPLGRTNAVAAFDASADGDAGSDGSVNCPAGEQDNDGDGTCLPDCETAGLDCAGHAHCDDGQGAVTCVCDDGYQDNDGNGSCLATCNAAALDCQPNSHCSDAEGVALCLCDQGFQDNDGDGGCLLTCTTAGETCDGHGACDDSGGEATCICGTGYSGEHCTGCALGYQDHDGDGSCAFNCDLANLNCAVHSHCDEASGEALCVCDDGYAGSGCHDCTDGYQDNDHDGECLPSCATAGNVCAGPGSCDDASGEADCTCDPGAPDNDDDGGCLPACARVRSGVHGPARRGPE